MATLKFGLVGLTKPTPTVLRNIFTAFLYLSGIWVFIAPVFNIPAPVLDHINKGIVEGLAILKFTISFFHFDYQIDANAQVDNTTK